MEIFLQLFHRISSSTREGTAGQVRVNRGSARRGKENAGALHLLGDWGQHVRPDSREYCGEVSWEGRATDDASYGVQGTSLNVVNISLRFLKHNDMMHPFTAQVPSPASSLSW